MKLFDLKSVMIFVALIGALDGCAKYAPQVTGSIDPEKYQNDVYDCNLKRDEIVTRYSSPAFGLLGSAVYYANSTDAEKKETEELSTSEGRKKYIDACMKSRGYRVVK